jgi:hypothetical protein
MTCHYYFIFSFFHFSPIHSFNAHFNYERFVNVKLLKKELLKNGISNIKTTAFYQGNTTRWAIGWSFSKRQETEEELGIINSGKNRLEKISLDVEMD